MTGDVPPLNPPALRSQTGALRTAIAEMVTALPGVVRLEPSLGDAVLRLGRTASTASPSGPPTTTSELWSVPEDGVRLTQLDNTIDARLDLTVVTVVPALVTARLAARTVRECVTSHGFIPGKVDIVILAIFRV